MRTKSLLHEDRFARSDDDHALIVGGDQPKLVTWGIGGRDINIWGLLDGSPVCTFIGHRNTVQHVCSSDDGTLLLTAERVADQDMLAAGTANQDLVKTEFLAEAKVWDLVRRTLLVTVRPHADIHAISLSRDRRLFVTAGRAGGSDETAGYVLRVWSVASGELVKDVEFTLPDARDGERTEKLVTQLRFSPSGRYLALVAGAHIALFESELAGLL